MAEQRYTNPATGKTMEWNGTTWVDSESQEPMTGAEFTQQRQQSAIQEPAFKTLERATLPTIGAAAGLIPGVGIPAQMAISGGATAVNQLLGLEPKSGKQVAIAAGMPVAGKLGTSAVKAGVKGFGELFNPGVMREVGAEAIAKTVGQEPTSLARLFTAPASRAAFEAVKTQGPLPAQKIVSAINAAGAKLTGMSNPPRAAVTYLQNMSKKFQASPTADYGDVVEEIQLLKNNADKAFNRGDVVTGRALNEMRAKVLNALDDISPAAKKANQFYRREQSSQELINAARSGNPGVQVRKLLENDSLVAGTFNKKETKEVLEIAEAISDVASASSTGIGRLWWSAITEPIGQALAHPVGRFFLRQTMRQGKIGPVGLSTAAQFMRAYMAQEEAATP